MYCLALSHQHWGGLTQKRSHDRCLEMLRVIVGSDAELWDAVSAVESDDVSRLAEGCLLSLLNQGQLSGDACMCFL